MKSRKQTIVFAVAMAMGMMASKVIADPVDYYGQGTGATSPVWSKSPNAVSGFTGEWNSSSGDESGSANMLYGGYSSSADVKQNSVTVSGGSINSNIYGGYTNSGSAEYNKVVFSGSLQDMGKVRIIGGASKSTDTNKSVSSNTVTINAGVSGEFDSVYGGRVEDDEDGAAAANSNTVEIYGTQFSADGVYGGSTAKGIANNNTVVLSGGSVTSVIGGVTGGNAAKNNAVIWTGGTISGFVMGGSATTSTGNTLVVTGSSKNAQFIESSWICVGRFSLDKR